MVIHSIHEDFFREYGRIVKEAPTEAIHSSLLRTSLPKVGSAYVPEEKELMNKEILPFFTSLYGDIEPQLGYCNGYNNKLNALEYHRDSEFNFGTEDFILLLAKRSDLDDKFTLSSDAVKAFYVPKDTLIEVYASTLHYCPINPKKDIGFRVLVALPKGTNYPLKKRARVTEEDALLFATNKWLICHKESNEAKQGAYIRIEGENLTVEQK